MTSRNKFQSPTRYKVFFFVFKAAIFLTAASVSFESIDSMNLAKTLEDLNSNDNYLPIMHASDMVPDKWYLCSKFEQRKTEHGDRMVLYLQGGNGEQGEEDVAENYILFLSPSYIEPRKRNLLTRLFKEPGKRTYIQCPEIIHNGAQIIPVYKFKSE